MVSAFPILTATLAMLVLDRYLGFHFFTNEAGGNEVMFVNLIWAFGHPEVYRFVLPAFGVFSEVVSTFSGKPLFGYRSMVAATMAICILSYTVWLHHFFTMGAGANVNAIFGIASMIIAVATGVKIFNWLFTMYGGRVVSSHANIVVDRLYGHVRDRRHDRRSAGGAPGGLRASREPLPSGPLPQRHHRRGALRRVRRLHLLVPEGVWLPVARRTWQGVVLVLDHRVFDLAFMPLYVLGLMGMTRRMQHYDVAAGHPWLLIAAGGAALILLGIGLQIAQFVVSIRRREELRDETGDPWNGRSLEWATPSPPPAFNFAVLPNIQGEEAYWGMKQRALQQARLSEEPTYADIEVPRNSPTGFVCAFFATFMGFALIWHIWWMVGLAALGAYATFVVFAWRDEDEYIIPAETVARIDRANRSARSETLARRQAAP